MTKKIKSFIVAIMFGTLLIMTPSLSLARGFGDMFGVSGVGVPGTSEAQEDALIHTIQTAINWVLGMLSFVAFVLCLYAGFKMLISGGDSKQYDAGFTILKNAAIGLAIIAVSWLIVSLIFRLINGSIGPNVSEGTDNSEVYPTPISNTQHIQDYNQYID